MEVTGQAFEDMQEQNSRLIQQLREKDDANFKLMSERIKSNQVYLIFKLSPIFIYSVLVEFDILCTFDLSFVTHLSLWQ